MAKIIIVDDLARYGFDEYERMLCQMPHFAKRGEEFRPYIEKLFKHGTILAIDEGGKLMGFMAFYANDQEGKVAYWSSLAVDPSLKGQGWGLRLLNCARAMSAEAGMKVARGTVVKTNAGPLAMYRWFGFEITESPTDPLRYNLEVKLTPPRLSIVCLAYNAAPYIRAAIDGFLMQKTNFPVEILVHDDASTDGTADIIREYAESYPGTVRAVLQKENQLSKGVMVSSEFLWPLIRGEYVAVCEGDDYWTDMHKLQKQVDWLDAHPESSICFHPVVVHFEDGSRKDSIYPSDKDCPGGYTFGELLRHNFIQTNSVVFRWKLKGREGDVPTDIAPRDWFTNLLHAEKGPIGFISEAMGVYRRHPGGVWWNSADAPDAFYLRNGFRHLAFYKAVKNRFGYDNPCAVDLAANTIAAELRAGHVDRAAETLKAYPDYACKALGVIAERDRLERELARSRRRLKRVIWAAAIAVALVLLALFA